MEPLGTFAATPQKFLDYAYRAVHVTAMSAKKILQTYYEACSTRPTPISRDSKHVGARS